ncbi:hypothetical protein ACJX0J_012955, partial [Zea mays]
MVDNAWMTVPTFRDWNMKNRALLDYSMHFSKIHEMPTVPSPSTAAPTPTDDRWCRPLHACDHSTMGGKFDHVDRLFQSMESAYINSLSNTSDVKELIPEFFYMSEFSENSNSYHLSDGEPIGDVALSPWAKFANTTLIGLALQRTTFAYYYVAQLHNLKVMIEALESGYVSSNLHNWIDLIALTTLVCE